jgi:hypothetical protein
MRNSLFIVGLLAALSLVPKSFSAEDSIYQSLGMSNGRLWVGISEGLKAFYMKGAFDSLQLCLPELPANATALTSQVQRLLLSHGYLTIGEYTESLDVFYREPLNRPIPVVYALDWVSLKASGMPENGLKEVEEFMRSKWSSPEKHEAKKP